MNLLIKNAKAIFLCGEHHIRALHGADMASPGHLEFAFVEIRNGRVHDYGRMENCPNETSFYQIIDAAGSYVLPAWVDSHTHLVYHESREEEFVYRIKGMSYKAIAESGGGILNSAKRLAVATEDELFDQAWTRLMEVISYGTGAIEIKSGYGLSFDAELKILRVIKRLKEKSPITIKATFLGAHAVPSEFKSDRQGYIDMLTEELLPVIMEEGLADYIDVFCDQGFFTVEETRHILAKGTAVGLRGKIHANELANSGGVQVGVEMNALSVDHLEMIENAEIDCLKDTNTFPVALPSTSFFLNLPYAPGRAMIDAGLPLVLASDYNPGSTPSGKIPFLLSLACLKMKLLPEEAISAATLNGACALELEKTHGSITKGKVANLIITKPIRSLAFIPYAFGSDHVDKVIINGEVWKG